jgi:hypothetical protein
MNMVTGKDKAPKDKGWKDGEHQIILGWSWKKKTMGKFSMSMYSKILEEVECSGENPPPLPS